MKGTAAASSLRFEPLDPWRIAARSAARVVLRRRARTADGRRAVVETVVETDSGDLSPRLRAALTGFVLFGTLSPSHLGALCGELAAARSQGGATAPPRDVSEACALVGPGVRKALDDPLRGILTGVLHRAVAGDGVGLVGLLDRSCAPDLASDAAIDSFVEECADLHVTARRALLALALRLARHVPPLPVAEIHAARDFFAWWRGTAGALATVVAPDGTRQALPLPAGTPPALAAAATRLVSTLAATAVGLGQRLGRRSDGAEILDVLGRELLDGLAGLVANGLCGTASLVRPRLETTLQPAGPVPTRARWCKALQVDGRPFHDTFGRFFAAPHADLHLPRSGRTLIVWRTGGCPFPDRGEMVGPGEVAIPTPVPR